MELNDFFEQREQMGITDQNYYENIIDYSINSLRNLDVIAKGAAMYDSEAERFVRMAKRIFEFRTDFILRNLISSSNDGSESIKLAETPENLIQFYLTENMLAPEYNSPDLVVGCIKIALNYRTSIFNISSPLIYAVAAILRSEKEIIELENSGLKENKSEEFKNIKFVINEGATTIYSFIVAALRVIENKILRTRRYFLCLNCGRKYVDDLPVKKCLTCGSSTSEISYIPLLYIL